jgi:hypothetical protein
MDHLQVFAVGRFAYFFLAVVLTIEDSIVIVKCRIAMKALFLFLNLCQSVMLNIVSNVHLHPYIYF